MIVGNKIVTQYFRFDCIIWHQADGFGAGSRDRRVQEEGAACAKALGELEEQEKGLCTRDERVEGRAARNEAGEGA